MLGRFQTFHIGEYVKRLLEGYLDEESGIVFQRKLDEMYQNCFGVKGIADDMLIIDQVNRENGHDSKFHKFLKVTRKNNLHLNAKKPQSN